MDAATRDQVRLRARGCCEYCHLPQHAAPFVPFHIEHVVAVQHGGSDELENLAWACHRCNAYKGTNLASIDPQSGETVLLFHPRRDLWQEHFRRDSAIISGVTACGRATARLLAFNDSYRIELRAEWLQDDTNE